MGALEKALKAKIIPDKDVKGAIAEADGISYDLTLPTLLDSKKDFLRKIIAEELER